MPAQPLSYPARRCSATRRNRLAACLVLFLCLTTSVAQAQNRATLRPAPKNQAAEIEEVYGKRTVQAGEQVNFRARLVHGTTREVEYHWDFGDGTRAEGNGVVHRYKKPGQYRLSVSVRNPHGKDTETLMISVTEPATPAPPPVTETRTPPVPATSTAGARPAAQPKSAPPSPAVTRPGVRGGSIDFAQGGYAWRVRSHFELPQAEQEARQYKQAGYRVGLITDDQGPGTTAYRIVIGQFDSVEQALRAKPGLPHQTGVLLMDLSDLRQTPDTDE